MPTEVTVVTSVSALDRAEWDALVPEGQVYLTHDWLRAVEESFGFELVLFLLRQDGRTVAGLQGLLLRDPDAFPYHDPVGALFGDYEREHLRQALARDRTPAETDQAAALLDAVVHAEAAHARTAAYPALVMTSPYGYACEVLTLPGCDRPAAVTRLLDAVEEYCAAEGIPARCFLWHGGSGDTLRGPLAAHGYLEFLSDLEYGLDVAAHTSFDDYVRGLDRKRRTVVRSEIRRFAESGLCIERVKDPAPETVARCAELSEGQHEKYGLPVERKAMERLFSTLLEAEALGTTLHVVRRDDADEPGSVVGFLLCLESGGVLHPKFLGFDAEAVGTACAYFNLTFYHLVEHALTGGARRIAYGMGSPDAKRLRGCGPGPVRGWIRFSSPAAHRRIEPYVTVFDCLKRQLLGSPEGSTAS
ncbi:GNAT family N-acetyltransferase [Streptomyces sp. NPDC001135]